MDMRPSASTPGASLSKVAIPRLRRESEAANRSFTSEKHRVGRACANCRKRKVKCSGERPRCKHCEDFGLDCVYVEGRRDQLKRSTEHNEQMTGFLRDLSSRVSPEDQEAIRKLVDSAPEGFSAAGSIAPSLKRRRSESKEQEEGGEAFVSASVGSQNSLDLIDEDLNRDEEARATGFVGKNSEVQWLRRLRQEVEIGGGEEDERPESPYGLAGKDETAVASRLAAERVRHRSNIQEHVSNATYHLDNDNLIVLDYVDRFEMPSIEVSDKLLDYYMQSVHDAFPILGKKNFIRQYNDYRTSVLEGRPLRLPAKWRAILNVVMAIGARHSHLIKANWVGDHRGHLIYSTRARLLALTADTVVNHPDLQQIQVVALLAIYYMTISHVSRAWFMSGLAVRYAFTLGLHIRIEDPKMKDSSKESRVRVWWTVYTLERLLGVITGRPSAILDRCISAPLPSNIDEESRHRKKSKSKSKSIQSETPPDQDVSSFSSVPPFSSNILSPTDQYLPAPVLCFRFRIRLDSISQDILLSLYAAGTAIGSWQHVQDRMTSFAEKLEQWRSSLPRGFDFTKVAGDSEQLRQQLILGFFYYSTKIMLTRPCLCRLDRRIDNQSDESKSFNTTMAQACVNSAKGIVDLLPDQPDPVSLYGYGPWWCIVHHLMQATSILLLEISFRAVHMPNQGQYLINPLRKLIWWLQRMSDDNAAAEKAWKMAVYLLEKLAPRVDADVSDVVEQARLRLQSLQSSTASGLGQRVSQVPQAQSLHDPGLPATSAMSSGAVAHDISLAPQGLPISGTDPYHAFGGPFVSSEHSMDPNQSFPPANDLPNVFGNPHLDFDPIGMPMYRAYDEANFLHPDPQGDSNGGDN